MNPVNEAKRLKVQVKQDHLSRISSCSLESAIAEMIWNAVDADADTIDVHFGMNSLGAIDEIIITDNGSGIRYSEAQSLFVALGGSWKAQRKRTPTGRFLHGQNGEGRFKAFALGKKVVWTITYREDDQLRQYSISGNSTSLDTIEISREQTILQGSTGVEVNISEIIRPGSPLFYDADRLIKRITPAFALYLSSYPFINIRIDGLRVDPSKEIKYKKKFDLISIDVNKTKFDIVMELIEWNSITSKEILFCDENGFPLEAYGKHVRGTGDFGYNAYLKSNYFAEQNVRHLLTVADLDSRLGMICDLAVKEIKAYFLRRMAENGKKQVDKWKAENVYPYKDKPRTPTEHVEQQLFDIVAIKVNQNLPNFEDIDQRTKAFQFRMLRQAIERSPEELQYIITQILNLPKTVTDQLAELLKDVSLAGIIRASKEVTDRLKFLDGLEKILFDADYRAHLKERSQLHRILAHNSWIFGNAFSLSADDKSLTEVLRKHLKKNNLEVIVDEPVKRIDGRRGIIDLMMTRSLPRNHSDEREHLIVELKAPKVKIGSKECTQLKQYAFAVAKDERFRGLNTRWNFWVLSNDMDDFAKQELNQLNHESGVLYKSSDPIDMTLWIKSWSQLIQENKHRLNFMKENLNFEADREESVQYLKKTYSELTDAFEDRISLPKKTTKKVQSEIPV